MKTKIVFGNAHTPEAIEKFQREHAEQIEEMIASGTLDRPAVNDGGKAEQNENPVPREQRKAA